MDIGFDPVGGGFFESKRMAGAGLDPILDIGQKPQHLVRSLMRDRHFQRKERHVLDFYAHLLDGRDENVAVRILAQYRREKAARGRGGRSACRNKTTSRRARSACRYRRKTADSIAPPGGAPYAPVRPWPPSRRSRRPWGTRPWL